MADEQHEGTGDSGQREAETPEGTRAPDTAEPSDVPQSMYDAADGNAVPATAQVQAATRAEGQEPRRILVVDDDQDIAEMVAMILEFAGYATQIAINGRQALDLVRAQPPALIITDLMMPELDGAGLIRAVRTEAAQAQRHAPPIVLMSAVRKEHLPVTGADFVLFKPFTVFALHETVARVLLDPGQQAGG